MNKTHTSTELKAMARHVLLGKYGVAVAICLLYVAIQFAASIFSEALGNGGTILVFLFSVLLLFVRGGFESFFMNIAAGRDYNVTDLAYLFSRRSGFLKAYVFFAADIFRSLYQALPLVPGGMLLYLYAAKGGLLYLFLGSGLLIPGILFSLFLMIAYSQTDLVIIEAQPGQNGLPVTAAGTLLTPIGAMRESADLMKGRRLSYLYLVVSFLGWLLLGICSCGIALLWILPYIYTTLSEFYIDLVMSRNRRNREGTQSEGSGTAPETAQAGTSEAAPETAQAETSGTTQAASQDKAPGKDEQRD